MTPPHILVVQHQDDCPPAWVGRWLVEAGCRLDPAIERETLQGDGHRSSPFICGIERDLTGVSAVDTMVASSNN